MGSAEFARDRSKCHSRGKRRFSIRRGGFTFFQFSSCAKKGTKEILVVLRVKNRVVLSFNQKSFHLTCIDFISTNLCTKKRVAISSIGRAPKKKGSEGMIL